MTFRIQPILRNILLLLHTKTRTYEELEKECQTTKNSILVHVSMLKQVGLVDKKGKDIFLTQSGREHTNWILTQ